MRFSREKSSPRANSVRAWRVEKNRRFVSRLDEETK